MTPQSGGSFRQPQAFDSIHGFASHEPQPEEPSEVRIPAMLHRS